MKAYALILLAKQFAMPRPKSKEQLITLSQKNYEALFDYVNALSEEQSGQAFSKGYLNRNIRDVLAHLHHWHLMLLGWYKEGMKGNTPSMPAPGYTWRTVPELNRKIWQDYKDVPLVEVKEVLDTSFKEVQAQIIRHTNEELFEKKRYPWTGSTSMGAYFISATSSHYDWALKLIKKCIN